MTDLSAEARRRLLELARHAIQAHLEGGVLAYEGSPPPEMQQRRGAFVTLRLRADGRLRGCVGRVETEDWLARTVAAVAVSAATADPRFAPLRLTELPAVRLEISALGTPAAIRPEEVVVGTHGLIVRYEGRSGLLLPQVPLEFGWGREAFLEWVCRKAKLPPETWRVAGCCLLGFTATVFGES